MSTLPFLAAARAAVLGIASLAALTAASAATVRLQASGVLGAALPSSFAPAVPAGTAIEFDARFEDRVSDGDYSDWGLGPGPVSGWARIGDTHIVLDGHRWRSASFVDGVHGFGFALTSADPDPGASEVFEGIFVSWTSVDGWLAEGLVGWKRPTGGGGGSLGFREYAGDLVVSAVPLPSSLALAALGLLLLPLRVRGS